MKVALLHYSAPPVVGGVERVLADHARLMTAAGHQVSIIAGKGSTFDRRIRFISIPLLSSGHTTIVDMKVQLDQGRVPSVFGSVVNRITTRLKPALESIDVLIAHNVCSLHKNLALTAALKEISRDPTSPKIVLWHHDLAWTSERYKGELHDGLPWGLLRTMWPGVKQVTVSKMRQVELAGLQKVPTVEIEVIPNGLDLSSFFKLSFQTRILVDRFDLNVAAPLLLLPVRITQRKNIELALQTISELRKSFSTAKLIVTGPIGPHNPANHDYFEKLRRMQNDLELNRCAHFLADQLDGSVPDDVISDLYRLADCLFLPSREEGFGLPIIEAGAAGLPIFCSDIPTLRELAGQSGVFFSPSEDPKKIAALIAANLTSNVIYQNRVNVRQRYDWQAVYFRHIAPLLEQLK
ncbi:MAG: glycosyltransferase family 4 protein [Anaerolineales bacterium]